MVSFPDSEHSDLVKVAPRKGKRRQYEGGGVFPISYIRSQKPIRYMCHVT
jgi:hypothetical protein